MKMESGETCFQFFVFQIYMNTLHKLSRLLSQTVIVKLRSFSLLPINLLSSYYNIKRSRSIESSIRCIYLSRSQVIPGIQSFKTSHYCHRKASQKTDEDNLLSRIIIFFLLQWHNALSKKLARGLQDKICQLSTFLYSDII